MSAARHPYASTPNLMSSAPVKIRFVAETFDITLSPDWERYAHLAAARDQEPHESAPKTTPPPAHMHASQLASTGQGSAQLANQYIHDHK